MDKQIIKTIITEKQNAVTKYSVIKRNFDFDSSANYVLVGLRKVQGRYSIYQF